MQVIRRPASARRQPMTQKDLSNVDLLYMGRRRTLERSEYSKLALRQALKENQVKTAKNSNGFKNHETQLVQSIECMRRDCHSLSTLLHQNTIELKKETKFNAFFRRKVPASDKADPVRLAEAQLAVQIEKQDAILKELKTRLHSEKNFLAKLDLQVESAAIQQDYITFYSMQPPTVIESKLASQQKELQSANKLILKVNDRLESLRAEKQLVSKKHSQIEQEHIKVKAKSASQNLCLSSQLENPEPNNHAKSRIEEIEDDIQRLDRQIGVKNEEVMNKMEDFVRNKILLLRDIDEIKTNLSSKFAFRA